MVIKAAAEAQTTLPALFGRPPAGSPLLSFIKQIITRDSIDIDHMGRYFKNIAADDSITIAYLFGSYLDETFNEHSDIDIALVFKEPPSEIPLLKIEMNLTDLLVRKFNIPFDIRTINNSPLYVKGEIITNGELLYSIDEEFRVDFETYVRSRYFDYLPTLRSIRKTYLESVKKGGFFGQT